MNKQELYDIVNDMKNEIIQSIEIEREVEYFETREVIQSIEELREEVSNSHERYWTKTIKSAPNPKDIFSLNKPVSILKAIALDEGLTIADRLVITIVYSEEEEVTTDLLLKLTSMSGVGLRRILRKLTDLSYIVKLKNGLYKSYDKKIF